MAFEYTVDGDCCCSGIPCECCSGNIAGILGEELLLVLEDWDDASEDPEERPPGCSTCTTCDDMLNKTFHLLYAPGMSTTTECMYTGEFEGPDCYAGGLVIYAGYECLGGGQMDAHIHLEDTPGGTDEHDIDATSYECTTGEVVGDPDEYQDTSCCLPGKYFLYWD